MNSVKMEVTNIVLHRTWSQVSEHAWYDVTNEVWVQAKMRLDRIKVVMMVDFNL
jgi:hypothetical protein